VIVVADRALDLGNVGHRHGERRSSESRVDTFGDEVRDPKSGVNQEWWAFGFGAYHSRLYNGA
jgi:hypothetical protein